MAPVPTVLLDVLTVAVFAYVGTNLVRGARTALRASARQRSAELLRGLRLRHFLPAPIVLALVLGMFAALYQLPPLRWGWWTAIGGHGNIVFGSTDATRGSFLEWLVPVVFIALLVPALPLFVELEERRFRAGAESWSTTRRAWRGVQFGLLHLIVGIPVAAALALSLGGWWFTAVYLRAHRHGGRRAALDESTRAHLAYDLSIIAVVGLGVALTACVSNTNGPAAPRTISVTSPAFQAGQPVPVRFSCRGGDVSPPLSWTGAPARTVAVAVVVDDPDAPNPPFTHWVVTGLAATTTSLAEGEVPAGAVQARNSAGQANYAGMCPPAGQLHHYRFSVHALSRRPRVDASTTPGEARKAVNDATLAQGTLIATFRS
jgi:hypothetical protein